MAKPDDLGKHERKEWSGTYEQFDPREQFLFLNAFKLYDMINAGRVHETAAAFWRFHFLIATILAHEVGDHLLITFLNHGRTFTPPDIGVSAYCKAGGGIGEAGRMLEICLFGGNLEYYQAPNQSMHDILNYQTGVTHIRILLIPKEESSEYTTVCFKSSSTEV
ncbi:hypothetical protein N7478_002249 [Penicillium angulare]|uniref:uncharacterized protein n=1 Tax=Penicillium angulare TaxID=116970 RepID=UPI002541B1B0|nr:uncharacterized protein N7478_002249 [Penicillium angulare]KAJ5289219.1 hypothetical protein N7478_002249 [Penicillium angulare]